MAIVGVCTNCFYLKSIPVNAGPEGVKYVNACVNRVPKTDLSKPGQPSALMGRAQWAIIDFPDDWTCGEGVDAATLMSYSAGVLSLPQGPKGDTGASGPAGLVFLSTLTAAASASLDFSGVFSATYNDYMISLENIVPVTNGTEIRIRVEAGGSFKTTTYKNLNSPTDRIQAASQGVSNSAGIGYSGIHTIQNVNDAGVRKFYTGDSVYWDGAAIQIGNLGGYWNGGNDVITGLQFSMSSGNISTGKITIWGMVKS